MIQDIEPRIFNNQFQAKQAEPQDLFLAYAADAVLVREDQTKLWYPSFADFAEQYPQLRQEAQFLFSIDDINYFLVDKSDLELAGWSYVSTDRFRTEEKYWRSFVGVVGWQIKRWYDNHRFCSRCGQAMRHAERERMLYCPACGFKTYPSIAPCVIVGVHSGNRMLLTKYAGRAYTRYALVAGFAEIGESLEQTVQREVQEEVGLQVKNLKFYKSQPWPFSDTLLVGFFAELDGDDTVTLQEEELSLAEWVEREAIPPADRRLSLTSEMMEAFRMGTIEL